MTGILALVGGDEWAEGCSFDAGLLARSGGTAVVVLATAKAYEHPDRAVERATSWFAGLGADVVAPAVLSRADSDNPELAAVLRAARMIYLSSGSALHLRAVLKQSAVWQALSEAWHDGAVVAGSGAGAMVLGDPMVDPRGGALTLGLGLIEQLAVLPEASAWSPERLRRTTSLTDKGVALLALDARTAAIRDPDGQWRVEGIGSASVHVGNAEGSLADLR
jgi:cyanophycinase